MKKIEENLSPLVPNLLHGDPPLTSIDQDEFGLQEVSSALARTLAHRVRIDGYTLGIEGAWGSGKSTLVNFVINELKAFPDQYIVRFEPWLIGDKNALLPAILGQLAAQLDSVERKNMSWWRLDYWLWSRWKSSLARQIRKYGESVGALSGPAGAAASLDPTGTTAIAAMGLRAVGPIAKFFGASASIDEQKKKITDDLRIFSAQHPRARFTVFIDDTDRLEPAEAIEILRLVRKVGDFPATSYVICFDNEVLISQIRNALRIPSANSRLYIDKIFQDVVAVPPQEPFALRRLLANRLTESFPTEMALGPDAQEPEYRRHLIFDRWAGEFLRTARDVIRLREAIVFGWPHLPPNSDFFDFIWLQMIKQRHRQLYIWVQRYLQNVGAYRDGGRAGDTEPKTLAIELDGIMKALEWSERPYLSGIGEFLPGISSFNKQGDDQKVFEFENGELERFEASNRLGSPSHWRQYFAYEAPSYALKDEELAAFRKTARSSAREAAKFIRTLLDKPHARKGHFLEILIDRLADAARDKIPTDEADGMLAAFAKTMDFVVRETDVIVKSGTSNLWRQTNAIIKWSSVAAFTEACENGKSLGWLANVVRDQAFAHGLPDGERAREERQWLTRQEIKTIISVFTNRLGHLDFSLILNSASPLDVLFCWEQLGDREVLRKKIADYIVSDTQFLRTLQALRSWSSSSRIGVHHPLQARYVTFFTDPHQAFSRLKQLSRNGKGAKAEKAIELLSAWEPDVEPQKED